MKIVTSKNLNLAASIRKHKKFDSNKMQLYSLLCIPMLLIFIFHYIPMVGIIIAFKNYKYKLGIFGSEWVGFKNFEFFFQSGSFWTLTRNTLVLNFIFIVTGIIAALFVAILLYELKSRISIKLFQTTLITPHFLSWVVVSYMAYALLNPTYGLLNKLLESMGLATRDWYSMPKAWPFVLTIASVWKHVGMDSVLYYAALMGIDDSLFEAADLDGASKLQRIWYVVIPSLVPIITITAILKIGNIFRADFGLFYQLTRDVGALYETTDVIDTFIFRTMRVVGDMGMSSAVGLLQGVVGVIMVLLTNRLSKIVDKEGGLF